MHFLPAFFSDKYQNRFPTNIVKSVGQNHIGTTSIGQPNICSTHEISQRLKQASFLPSAILMKEVIRRVEYPEKERRGITFTLVVIRKVA
jgi:hypothetical protein